jgi:hypothetical protein
MPRAAVALAGTATIWRVPRTGMTAVKVLCKAGHRPGQRTARCLTLSPPARPGASCVQLKRTLPLTWRHCSSQRGDYCRRSKRYQHWPAALLAPCFFVAAPSSSLPPQQALLELHDQVLRKHAPPLLSGTQLYAQLERCRLLQTVSCTRPSSKRMLALLAPGARPAQQRRVPPPPPRHRGVRPLMWSCCTAV